MNKKIILIILLLFTACSKKPTPEENNRIEIPPTVTIKPDKDIDSLNKHIDSNMEVNKELEENQKQINDKKCKEEEKRKKEQEDQKRIEEETLKREEQKKLEAERLKQEEEKRKEEEQKKLEAERLKQEEEKKRKKIYKNSITYNEISYPIENGNQVTVDKRDNTKWVNITPFYSKGSVQDKYIGDGNGLMLAAHGDSELGAYMRDNKPSFIFTDYDGNQQKYIYYGYIDVPRGDELFSDDPYYPWATGQVEECIVFQICDADSYGRGIGKGYVFVPEV